MEFGENFLPTTGWALNDATYDETTMLLQATGSASILLTEIAATNLIPEALKISVTANQYSNRYTPTTFIRVKIEFIDGNFFTATLPIIDNKEGSFEGIIYPYISAFDINVSAFTAIEITIYSSVIVSLTGLAFCKALSEELGDVVKLNETYYGVNISQANGLVVTKSNDTSKAILNSDNLKFQSSDDAGETWDDRLYYRYDEETGKTTLVLNGELSTDMLTALSGVLTPNLYADYGDVSDLTVNRLYTADLVDRYKDSDASDVDCIEIENQHIFWKTGSTDGSTIQHTDIRGRAQYWTTSEMQTMSSTLTQWPVLVYYYIFVTKMSAGFEMDIITGYNSPEMWFGAGDGQSAKSGKAVLKKSDEGISLTYYKRGDLTPRQLLLTDSGVETNPPMLLFPDTTNSTELTIEEATVLPGIGVIFQGKTRVAFDVQIDITSSQAMSLLLEARVAGSVQRHATKYFSGAYKDTFCFNGVFDAVTEGTKLVDMLITPSSGAAHIAINDYRFMLTIRNGSSEEAAAWPEIKTAEWIKVRPAVSESVLVEVNTPISLLLEASVEIPFTLEESITDIIII